MSDTDESLVKSAINEMLARDPNLLTGVAAHVVRANETPAPTPARTTPEQVAAEIKRLTAREPDPVDPSVEMARRATEYEAARAKRELDEATARMTEIFRSIQPHPETRE